MLKHRTRNDATVEQKRRRAAVAERRQFIFNPAEQGGDRLKAE